ncbi:MAG: serine-type D-Ala-D-Ala carboxypeptidase, partial [Betaproteobacteria bacterium]
MHLIFASLLLAFASSVYAQSAPLPVPPPPAIAAKSHLLVDFNTGRRLAEQNPQMRVEPASLTKLMT